MSKPARVAAAVALLVGTLAVAAALWVRHGLTRPYAGWSGERVDVLLEPGLDAGAMLRQLGRAGVVRHPELARRWLSWRGGAERLRAGEYRFSVAATPAEVLRRLETGDVLLHPVTIPEGLVLEEVARRLVDAGFGPHEGLLAAFRDPAPIATLDERATDLEGYLFPETYHFPRGEQARRIAAAMVAHFRESVGDDYAARAGAVGLELREAVILASLIEEETSLPEERDRISRVFHNRLKRGMRLQCDPTVLYALHRAGETTERLTYADLEFDSPWNTYRIAGLPRGPISNPGRESLIAAVRPADGDELYFVAAPEGGHRFSVDLPAHRKAVAAWRAYLRSSR